MFYLIDVIGSGLLSSIQGPKVKGRFHLFMYVVEPMEERSKNLLFLCLKRLTVWLLCFCLHVIFAYAFWNSVLAVIKEVFVIASDNVSLVLLAVKFSFVIFTDMKCILISIYSTNIYSLAELKVLIICCQLSVTTFSILTKYAQSILKKGFQVCLHEESIKPPLNPFHNE